MKQNRVTIKDLARQLGISTSTVSRALRDHPEINHKTKKKVLALAKALDYQPDLVSLSLLQKKTHTIGVVVPKMGYHFFSEVMNGIESVTNSAGFTVIVAQTNESYELEVKNVHQLAARRVDGFLVSIAGQTTEFDHFRHLKKNGTPLVFFDRECEEMDTSKVLVDNYNAAKQAVKHLIEEGCQRIAYLGGPERLSLSNARWKGYADMLEAHGLPAPPELVAHCDFSPSDTIRATQDLLNLPQRPDAILAMSDRLAFNAIRAIREAGLTIPHDIAIVGFNNEPVDTIIDPPLTSISMSEFELGKVAAELLLEEIENEELVETRTIIQPARLVVRASSKKRG